MDPLTHVFLPLLVAYVLVPEAFPSAASLLLGLFGLLPDLDKLLGAPGLLHSVLTIGPLCAGLVLADRWRGGGTPYGTLVAAFVASHVFFDFLDGSGFYALYPLSEQGVGLRFPMAVTFGEGLLGVRFVGPPVEPFLTAAPTGHAESAAVDANTFGLLDPVGVALALAFLAIYLGERARDRPTDGER